MRRSHRHVHRSYLVFSLENHDGVLGLVAFQHHALVGGGGDGVVGLKPAAGVNLRDPNGIHTLDQHVAVALGTRPQRDVELFLGVRTPRLLRRVQQNVAVHLHHVLVACRKHLRHQGHHVTDVKVQQGAAGANGHHVAHHAVATGVVGNA